MRSFAKLLATALTTALLTSPLLAQQVSTDYDHTFRFDKIKDYAWGKVQATDPLIEPRLSAAIDQVLQGYGLKESSKTGDVAKPGYLIVTAIEATSTDQYSTFYNGMPNLDWHRAWSAGSFSDSAASLDAIQPGTLIVDMYDGPTGKLVWRGVAVQPVAAKERKNQDNVVKSVHAMLAKFPPKNGKSMPPNQQEVPPSASSTSTTSPH